MPSADRPMPVSKEALQPLASRSSQKRVMIPTRPSAAAVQKRAGGRCPKKIKLLMALYSTAMEKITDSRPVLMCAAAA